MITNSTLQQMVKDQNEAWETRKVEAEKLKGDLDERNKIVDARREEAEADLANAEPALLAAQEAVKSIKRKHLDEMRAWRILQKMFNLQFRLLRL